MVLSHSVSFRALLAGLVALPCMCASVARAQEPEQGPSQQQIEAFLSEKPVSPDVNKPTEAPEAPPPPPRRHGFVVESSIGAQTQLGAMRHVSPTSPWLRTAFGWEPTRWIMLLAQFDVTLSSTSLAASPPNPRSYALYAGSLAVRGTIPIGTSIGAIVQGEIGGAKLSENVLSTYGFRNADTVNPFFGAAVGVEWYQVSPHLALGARGGIRSYGELFDRTIGGGGSLGWTVAATLRYVF
jgi:hypothetical protein